MRQVSSRFLTFSLSLSIACCSTTAIAGSRAAHGVDDDGIVLIDFNGQGSNAMAYLTADMTVNRLSTMKFMRLSPPISESIECCARVNRSPSFLDPANAPVNVISTVAQIEVATQFTTVHLPKGQHTDPLVGIGFSKAVSKVVRENDHAFLVKRPGGKPDLRVQHCVTGEAFSLRVTDAASSKERRRYYLPLGMDVEADCTEEIMPTATE